MSAEPATEQEETHAEAADHAEKSVIGAILVSGGRVLDHLNLDSRDYRHPLHEAIHQAAESLKAQGVPPDVLTVADHLRKARARFQDAYLHHLAGLPVAPSSAEHYAHIVAEHASRRRASEAATMIQNMVATHADPTAIQETAQKALDGITPAASLDPVKFTGETMTDTITDIETQQSYTPTPWPSLDHIIGGLIPGALYVIGARPGVGKTVAGVQLARAMAAHGSVPVVSLEMSTTELHMRMIASTGQIPFNKLRDRDLDDADWDRIHRAKTALEPLPIAIMDRTSASISDIRRYVTAVARLRSPMAGVVIDYLQLINAPAGDTRPRHENVAALTRELKTLAKEHQVPIILLSQLNRGSTQREDKRPQLADLRESGAIEQDSDVVILLHRLIDDPAAMHEIELRVAKNRHGRPGSTTLDFWGHYSEIRDGMNR